MCSLDTSLQTYPLRLPLTTSCQATEASILTSFHIVAADPSPEVWDLSPLSIPHRLSISACFLIDHRYIKTAQNSQLIS